LLLALPHHPESLGVAVPIKQDFSCDGRAEPAEGEVDLGQGSSPCIRFSSPSRAARSRRFADDGNHLDRSGAGTAQAPLRISLGWNYQVRLYRPRPGDGRQLGGFDVAAANWAVTARAATIIHT